MKKSMVMACILALGLCACADVKPKDEEDMLSSTITIEKDGSIKSRLVEDFGANYSEEDLKKLIDMSITAYKGKSAMSQIELASCEKDNNGKLIVEMAFNDTYAYAGWNNYFIEYMYASELGLDSGSIESGTQGFFAGTISDAYSAGYSLDVTLNAISDSSIKKTIAKSDLLGMGSNHIVLIERYGDDGPINVKCYNDILYTGEGVSVTGKKSASINTSSGYGVIVFK